MAVAVAFVPVFTLGGLLFSGGQAEANRLGSGLADVQWALDAPPPSAFHLVAFHPPDSLQVADSLNLLDSLAGGPHAEVIPAPDLFEEIGSGQASYYGNELAGHRTASGERFDPAQLTAAHRTLPFGTMVRVTNMRNGRTVVVRINDRGPFTARRIIDLSRAAAKKIGMLSRGTAKVRLEVVGG